MKKYLALFGAITTALVSTSCEKDYVCECTTTYIGSNSASINQFTIKDARKTHAKARCVTTEDVYTYGNAIITYTNTCELK